MDAPDSTGLKADDRIFLSKLARAYAPAAASPAERTAFDARLRERVVRADRSVRWAPAASLITAATVASALFAVRPSAPPQARPAAAAGVAVLLAAALEGDSQLQSYRLPTAYAVVDRLMDDPSDSASARELDTGGEP